MTDSAQPRVTDADAAATVDALRLLADRPNQSQWQLSQALGLSLGESHQHSHRHTPVGRLASKGHITAIRLARSRVAARID